MKEEGRKTKGRAILTVATMPKISDPRELQTILTTSLRDLWGKLEAYSCSLNVRDGEPSDTMDNVLSVHCPAGDVEAIQAALTLVTPPHYMEGTIYRFDVLQIDYE
jgi:RNase P/RNase MRP subunit POP5